MKPYYDLIEIRNFRFIIRNKWHSHTGGEFPYLSIEHEKMSDRFEFKIGLLGFSLVIMKDNKK